MNFRLENFVPWIYNVRNCHYWWFYTVEEWNIYTLNPRFDLITQVINSHSLLITLFISAPFQRREMEAAFWFSILLNLKHIYLYVAPAYFIYLLRSYCLSSTSDGRIKLKVSSLLRLLQLGVTVLAVFGLSFGPFYLKGQLGQVGIWL